MKAIRIKPVGSLLTHTYKGRTVHTCAGETSYSWWYSWEGGDYQNRTTRQFGHSLKELEARARSDAEKDIDMREPSE